MTGLLEREAVDLDELVDLTPRCQASHVMLKTYSGQVEDTTVCDIVARWLSMRTCDGRSILWCESRHAEHLEDAGARFIVCLACGRHVSECFRPTPL